MWVIFSQYSGGRVRQVLFLAIIEIIGIVLTHQLNHSLKNHDAY